ncbi:MAG TPA: hypothetical protein ENK18_02780 [Deltaproteobacteria bacterium]|nr:hypothetical protein [Deltaproteobacteria bacterium]
MTRWIVSLLLPACIFDPVGVPDEHRSEAEECVAGRATWEVELPITTSYYGYGDGCTAHEDCTDGDEGRCSSFSGRGGPYLQCTYTECLTDADCGGGVCRCAGDGEQDHNTCLPAGDCQTDADCGDDYCSPSVTSCGPGWGLLGYFCHTRGDECRSDSDCGSDYDYCAYDEIEGRWTCRDSICVG